ncbi:hypothetical protein KO495_01405 [Colwellia sp. D2M02]|uniref:hypothetical protein n=1 Tax=Colwellia sp. D2M02 TaxID=2841562 RepID=UPI001C094050|nr:hypothetical protein [Colwellia sp. D2M02]MBU2891975.1 hypothetical protein [Colwellia sp. D2M02]
MNKLGIVIITLYLSACGLDVDRDKKAEPITATLTETDMTGIWLLEKTTVYTKKSDGLILDTTIEKSQTYIEDTENGIASVRCRDMAALATGQPSHYEGFKTDDKYFPLGESDTVQPYLFEQGVLVQEITTDAMYGEQEATELVRKTLTYIKSKESVYSDGTIALNGPLTFSATDKICTEQLKQTQLERNETNKYTFKVPFSHDEQDLLEIVLLFAGNPSTGFYNLDTSATETGFIEAYIHSEASSYYEALGNVRPHNFGEPGWIDLISTDQNSFEGNFSVTIENHGVLTGYIEVDMSGLQ